MLTNFLKITWRQLLRYKTFSIINILGLTAGITCSVLIGLYIADEFTFDRHHANVDRIVMPYTEATFDGQTNRWTGVPNIIGPTAAAEIPEVEKAARFFSHNFGDIAFITAGEIQSSEKHLAWADPDIFQILSYEFVHGDPQTVLKNPMTAVMSEAAALKYFGTTDAVGKNFKIDNSLTMEVTGVFRNPPANSRFVHPIIASFGSNWFGAEKNQSWSNASFETLFLLRPGTDPATFETKLGEMLARHLPKEERWFSLHIKELKDLYLYSDGINEMGNLETGKGDLAQLKILGILGFIILLIAAVNYMNMSTAQSQRRFKEIGVGKALGATRQTLARKFYLETALFVVLSLVISLILITSGLEIFNQVTGKQLTLEFLTSGAFWLLVTSAIGIIILIAGFYPALYLSSFSAKEVLKGGAGSIGGHATFRKALVVVQFTASIVLIISTVILQQQMSFIRDRKLGYQPEQVVAIMATAASRDQMNSVKEAMGQIAGVKLVARAQSYPGGNASGRTLPKPGGGGEGADISTVRATHEVLDVLGIKLLAGKSLPEVKDPKDTTVQVVLNKSSVDYLGLSPEDAVNRRIEIYGFEGQSEIVGVCEDFHFASLHEKIGAYCFHNARTEGLNYLLVKLDASNLSETMASMETTFKKVIPSAFEYTFLDDRLDAMYRSEQRLAMIIFFFASLAICIACMGLFALAAYTTERRTKEIGIRKVLGASVWQLTGMLSADFVKLVALSFVIAAPAGYYLMQDWLNSFAYRVSIHPVVLLVAGLVAIAIATVTVSVEAMRAAGANPVKSLRTE